MRLSLRPPRVTAGRPGQSGGRNENSFDTAMAWINISSAILAIWELKYH
jgi:hypothetical protein